MITPRRPPSIFESFNFAIEGIIHVLRTQRNMRIHFGVAVAVLIAALAFDVSRLELIALLIAIAFVLIAEMFNTAVEAAVDVASTSFDPMAKLAKDIGAGAVLIASINAIAVGYLVFSGQVADESSRLLDKLSEAPAELTLIALVLTIALGLVFLLTQFREYSRIGFAPYTDAFGTVFFCLTGLHGAHVFVGLTLLLAATIRSFRGHYSEEEHLGVEIPGIYWHFVDVMWIVVYTTVYIL